MTLALTIGAGRKHPQGNYLRLPDGPSVLVVLDALKAQPSVEEGWVSPHLFRNNYRAGAGWLGAAGVLIDFDYDVKDEMPPSDLVERLIQAVKNQSLPGNCFYATPRGGRAVFIYPDVNSDREIQIRAEKGAAALVSEALASCELFGFTVDTSCVADLARFYYLPKCVAKGVQRNAEVISMRFDPYTAVDLSNCYHEPAPAPLVKPVRKLNPAALQSFEEASARWCTDHRRTYPRDSSRCPVCDDSGSFGHLPDNPERWYCFSTDHPDGVGVTSDKGHHGDALDLEAHSRGCKPVDVLRRDGYLATPNRKPRATVTGGAEPEPAETPSPDSEPFRPWRSRSYLTAVDIIGNNARDVLNGRALEFNEMSGDITLGRKLIHASDVSKIRSSIEARFVGGLDKNNNEIGLQLSIADMERAVEQVAHTHPYHPVRDYLNSLAWDGVSRLDHVAKSIIGATGTQIENIIVRKFFTSAVARAIEPGCKVDTVFVLVGPQGAYKSSFFRVLAGDWFIDTPIDISGDTVRAYMTMRKAWILEFAELESLLRARDQNSVKAFLSSQADNYVPKYSRYPVDVKRGGVIVGTWNPNEQGFLNDPTGERRYWPINTGPEIDLSMLKEQRDQLWAEAVTIYRAHSSAECPWWLTTEEKKLLDPVHEEHAVRDVWAVPVLDWLGDRPEEVTVQEILSSALCVPRSQWTDRDSKRVARILRASGQWKPNPNKEKGKPRSWIRTGVIDRGQNH